MMKSIQENSGEYFGSNKTHLQLFDQSESCGKGCEPDGFVFGSFDMHLGLSKLEKMLTLIENVNPMDYTNKWFFDQFSRIIGVFVVDPLALLTEIVLVLRDGSASFRYSEYIECMRMAIHELKIEVATCSLTLLSGGRIVDNPEQIWRQLIQCVWLKFMSSEFMSQKKWRLRRAMENKESLNFYVNTLLKKYKRLLVIRIDFSYKTEYASSITEHEARSDLSRLFSNRRRNKDLIPDLVGYICRIEWSEKTRYHFHVMLFIDGDKRMKDAHISYKTGLYWENVITKGRGRFYSCNYSSQGYDRCGIGMIHYSNPIEVSNLMDCALSYLYKKDQYLLAHSVGHRKNVWTGQMPQ